MQYPCRYRTWRNHAFLFHTQRDALQILSLAPYIPHIVLLLRFSNPCTTHHLSTRVRVLHALCYYSGIYARRIFMPRWVSFTETNESGHIRFQWKKFTDLFKFTRTKLQGPLYRFIRRHVWAAIDSVEVEDGWAYGRLWIQSKKLLDLESFEEILEALWT